MRFPPSATGPKVIRCTSEGLTYFRYLRKGPLFRYVRTRVHYSGTYVREGPLFKYVREGPLFKYVRAGPIFKYVRTYESPLFRYVRT